MIKKVIAGIIAVSMLLPLYTVSAAEKIYIHISPNGSDSIGKGTEAEPYQTFERAVEAVATAQKNNPKSPIDVIFHEGTYRFTNTVNLKEENSGKKDAPVTFRAAEGEKVVFTNSKEIDLTKITLVNDVETLQKLPVTSRGKVGKIDLKEQGIISVAPFRYYNQYSAPNNIAYINVYLDGKEQPISQWPNGVNVYSAYNMTISGGSSGERGTGGTIQTKDYRLIKWQNAKDMVMDIWGGNDYAMDTNVKVASVNASEKQITFATGTDQGLGSQKSKRFKVKNLLEELDMPGEWYIDREKLMLYYYPEKSLDNAKMEITAYEADLFNITNLKYVNFYGINFERIRGSVFWGTNRWENVTIDNCSFENIGTVAIRQFSTAQSKIGVGAQASQYRENGCINLEIVNSSFINIGRGAISIRQSGGRDTLEDGNAIVENCYFSNTNSVSCSGSSIQIDGVNNRVRNNTIHNGPYGVNYVGMKTEVNNNEIYNIQRYLSDAGAIYSGRNFINRDNKVYQNYVRDVSNRDPHMNTNYNRHVYIDDADCGNYVYNNIFVGKAFGSIAINGGQDNHAYNNVLVNNERALLVNSWTMNDESRIKRYKEQAEAALNNEYYSKWHDIYAKGASDEYAGFPAFNETRDNVIIGGVAEISEENIKYSDIGESIEATEEDFINYDEGDYRMADKEKYPNLPNEDNFDYNEIGIDGDKFVTNPAKADSFRLVYPQNGAVGISRSETEFMWQLSHYADYYKFVLATDSEMKNIVTEKIVYENCVTLNDIELNQSSYYWKVYAYNDSLNYPAHWASVGVPYQFTTTKQSNADTEALAILKVQAEKRLKSVKEGNESGKYIVGYTDKLNETLSKLNDILAGLITSKYEINSTSEAMQDLLDNEVYVNCGYYNLSTAIEDKDNWIVKNSLDSDINIEENKITVLKDRYSELVFGYNDLDYASRKIVMCFKMKVDFGDKGDSNWIGFGMRGKTGEILYGGGNDQYFLVMKEGILEYQRNTGGTNKILDTVEREDIKSNEWMDVQFGVIDLQEIGVLTILKINGEIAYQAIDTDDNRVKNKGTLNFMVTKTTGIEITGADELPENDIENLINEYTLLMTKENCEKVQKEIAADSVILKAGSKKVYVNNELSDIASPIIKENGTSVMTYGTAEQLFEAKVEKIGNYVKCVYKNHTLEFTVGSKQYKADSLSKEMNVECKDGYLPLRVFAENVGLMVEYHNAGLTCIMERSAMNTANYDWLLTSTAMCLSIYE